jgi:hypothetical protein
LKVINNEIHNQNSKNPKPIRREKSSKNEMRRKKIEVYL